MLECLVHGSLSVRNGDLDEALEDFNMYLDSSPDAFGYCTRGIVKHLKNDYGGALEDFNSAIELNQKCAAG
jgi:tetratricopeptide (TPR) repeat protein